MDTLYFARGTCGAIDVTLYEDGSPLEMGADDYLVLTVRETASESSPVLLRLVGQYGKTSLGLHEADTMLPVGKYSADVRLYRKLDAGYCTFSVWGVTEDDSREKNLKNFVILAGVGDGND